MTTIQPAIKRTEMNALVERAGFEKAYVREIAFTPAALRVEIPYAIEQP